MVRLSRITLFVLNSLTFCSGITLIVLASLVIYKDNTYGVLLRQGTFSLPIIVLLVGIGFLIIGFLGCCGALKENYYMLSFYACTVLILLTSEIILGALLIVFNKKAEHIVEQNLVGIFNNYGNGDQVLQAIIDHVQNYHQCCGVNNYTDWVNFNYGQKYSNSVPEGCCKNIFRGCGRDVISNGTFEEKIYKKGCYETIIHDSQILVIGFGMVCIIFAVFKLMCVSCACGLATEHGMTSVQFFLTFITFIAQLVGLKGLC